MVTVFIALTVSEGEAIVPLRFIVPAHALFAAVICAWTLEALFSWKWQQVGAVPLSILTFRFPPDHDQGKV